MKVRAVVALAAGQALEILDVTLDGPKPGEVLVEIKATGICHAGEFTMASWETTISRSFFRVLRLVQ